MARPGYWKLLTTIGTAGALALAPAAALAGGPAVRPEDEATSPRVLDGEGAEVAENHDLPGGVGFGDATPGKEIRASQSGPGDAQGEDRGASSEVPRAEDLGTATGTSAEPLPEKPSAPATPDAQR